MNYRSENGIESQVYVEYRPSLNIIIIDQEVGVDVKDYPNIGIIYWKNRKDIFKENNDHIILTKFKLAQIIKDEVIVTIILDNVVRKGNKYLNQVKKTYRLRYRFNCEMSNYQLVKIEM